MGLAKELVGLISILLLAYPAFYVARYGVLARRLSEIRHDNRFADDSLLVAASKQLAEQKDRWTRLHGFCLASGTALAIVASLLGLIIEFFKA